MRSTSCCVVLIVLCTIATLSNANVVMEPSTGNLRVIPGASGVITTQSSNVLVNGTDILAQIDTVKDSSSFIASLFSPTPRFDTLVVQQLQGYGSVAAEPFEIPGVGYFLVVANSLDDSISPIYKWDGSQYQIYQNITVPTGMAVANWKFWSTGGFYFLAQAMKYRGNSPLFRWDTATLRFTNIYDVQPPSGGRGIYIGCNCNSFNQNKTGDWEFFSLTSTMNILCTAVFENGKSFCYKNDRTATLALQWADHKVIPTYGATDVEHFIINNKHFVAFTNSDANNGVVAQLYVSVYYVADLNNWFWVQNLTATSPLDICVFAIDGTTYMAVADYGGTSNGDTQSSIWKWVVDGAKAEGGYFTLHQKVNSYGGRDFEHFSMNNGRDHYLFLSNEHATAGALGYKVPSRLFKFNGKLFGDIGPVSTSGAARFRSYSIGTQNYGFVANFADAATSTAPINSYVYKLPA